MRASRSQPPPAKLFKSDEHEKVINMLEKRLEKHDKNRKALQNKFEELRNKLAKQFDELEERISKELEDNFIPEDDRLQSALDELHGNSTISALQKAKTELCTIQSYEIIENKEPNNAITTLYGLKTERSTIPDDDPVRLVISEVNSSTNDPFNVTEVNETLCDSEKFAEEREPLMGLLKERLEKHDENRKAAQDKLHEICEGLKTQIVELEDKINKELEDKFISEDDRLQAALNELRGNSTASALQKARAELLVEQLYYIIECKDPKPDLTTLYKLKVERRVVLELIETRKPANVSVAGIDRGMISVQFTCLNPDEKRVLSDCTIMNPVRYKCLLFKKGNEQENKEEYPLKKNRGGNDSFAFTPDIFVAETTYGIRVKMVVRGKESEWSDEIAEFTPEFKECCVWKKCPNDVDFRAIYDVNWKNPRIVTKVYSGFCTIIGNTHIPPNAVTSWGVKILKSKNNNGSCIRVGVAPFDINRNDDYNCDKCGWYFDCWSSTLYSGPPHNYRKKEYGPRKEDGEYVHTGDSVGVVVDTTKGDLSFILSNLNLGVAFEGIPLDKPLIPCIIILFHEDSVELI